MMQMAYRVTPVKCRHGENWTTRFTIVPSASLVEALPDDWKSWASGTRQAALLMAANENCLKPLPGGVVLQLQEVVVAVARKKDLKL